jgi:glutamyl-tRNA synthetase
VLTPETRKLIGELRSALEAVDPWAADTATPCGIREAKNLKLGAIAQPLRVALRADNVTRNFRCFGCAGRQTCLDRLQDQAVAS